MNLFAIMFVQYFLVVANTRAYTQSKYMWTAITDILFCLLSFVLVRFIAESKTWTDVLWYTAGGTLGAQASIFLTKKMYKKD